MSVPVVRRQTMAESAIENTLSQHADQVSFLWSLRAHAVSAPHFDLSDLTALDLRLEANIDGLRVAGDDGWQLASKELAWQEPGEVFAAAVLALESGNQPKIDSVLIVAARNPALSRGFIAALGWLDYQQAEPHIKRLCYSPSSAEKRIGIAAASIHRKDPGRPLNEAISDPDVPLRARAFRAAGELGRTDLVPLLQRDLSSEDPNCQFWAAWSIALLAGYGNAIERLRSIAESPSPFRERALQMALRRMNPNAARDWQQALTRNPKTLRLAVIAAGAIGDPSEIPWLIEHMSAPPLARVAGEAFTMITGVDLAYDDLDADKPEHFESGPTEDPNDDNVDMDPDEHLPWPDPALISQWWQKHASDFQPGIRHIIGRPITAEWLQHVLCEGRQRQRSAAALELAMIQPGGSLFEIRAAGFRQQEILQLALTRA